MKLTEMTAGILPYSDGSGYTFELKINEEGAVQIKQAGDILIFTKEQWRSIRPAVEALFTVAEQLASAEPATDQ